MHTLFPSSSASIEESISKARQVSARIKPSRAWETMKPDGKVYPDPDRSGRNVLFYSNRLYAATVRQFDDGWPLGGGPWAQIGVYCPDGEPRHDWRELQCIKNDIVGPEWEGIELFPAESRLLDPSNYYLLYCAPKIPIGKYCGRTIMLAENCIAPQRGWVKPPRAEGLMDTPLLINPEVRGLILNLRQLAQAHPVQMIGLSERLKIPEVKALHMVQMTQQSILIPLAFMVTFSIEVGHPCGTCRHLSMSVQRKDRVPSPPGVWMVAQEFGFWGSLKSCSVWLEDLAGHGKAVNLVQPVESPE